MIINDSTANDGERARPETIPMAYLPLLLFLSGFSQCQSFLTSNLPRALCLQQRLQACRYRNVLWSEILCSMPKSSQQNSNMLACPSFDFFSLEIAAPEVIANHGRLKPLGIDGEITNDCSPDKIPSNWRPLVSQAVDAFHDAASQSGLSLAAVYLGGSVPRGFTLDGRSDLSMFGYFIPPPGNPLRASVHKPRARPSQKSALPAAASARPAKRGDD